MSCTKTNTMISMGILKLRLINRKRGKKRGANIQKRIFISRLFPSLATFEWKIHGTKQLIQTKLINDDGVVK